MSEPILIYLLNYLRQIYGAYKKPKIRHICILKEIGLTKKNHYFKLISVECGYI